MIRKVMRKFGWVAWALAFFVVPSSKGWSGVSGGPGLKKVPSRTVRVPIALDVCARARADLKRAASQLNEMMWIFTDSMDSPSQGTDLQGTEVTLGEISERLAEAAEDIVEYCDDQNLDPDCRVVEGIFMKLMHLVSLEVARLSQFVDPQQMFFELQRSWIARLNNAIDQDLEHAYQQLCQ